MTLNCILYKTNGILINCRTRAGYIQISGRITTNRVHPHFGPTQQSFIRPSLSICVFNIALVRDDNLFYLSQYPNNIIVYSHQIFELNVNEKIILGRTTENANRPLFCVLTFETYVFIFAGVSFKS